jgi:deoxyribodipyrimidine photolyase-like uncharacterized protein
MTPTEIISADIQAHGKDPKADLNAINAAVQAKKGFIMQSGNTVLFLLMISPEAAELHLYTQDRPIAVGKALQSFIDGIRKSGIKVVYGSEEPQQVLSLLKFLDVTVEPSDNPKYKWMART